MLKCLWMADLTGRRRLRSLGGFHLGIHPGIHIVPIRRLRPTRAGEHVLERESLSHREP